MTKDTAALLTLVLDASALLAVVNVERGAERVAAAIEARPAVVGAVNWSEAVAKLAAHTSDDQIAAVLRNLDVPVQPFSPVDAVRAGTMVRGTPTGGLCFGDRACLALARRLGATVLTADPAWSGVDVGVANELIR